MTKSNGKWISDTRLLLLLGQFTYYVFHAKNKNIKTRNKSRGNFSSNMGTSSEEF